MLIFDGQAEDGGPKWREATQEERDRILADIHATEPSSQAGLASFTSRS